MTITPHFLTHFDFNYISDFNVLNWLITMKSWQLGCYFQSSGNMDQRYHKLVNDNGEEVIHFIRFTCDVGHAIGNVRMGVPIKKINDEKLTKSEINEIKKEAMIEIDVTGEDKNKEELICIKVKEEKHSSDEEAIISEGDPGDKGDSDYKSKAANNIYKA